MDNKGGVRLEMIEMVDRDKEGKFVSSEDSLYPKTIGLRLHRRYYQQFVQMAADEGVTPVELARRIIQEYLEASKIESHD